VAFFRNIPGAFVGTETQAKPGAFYGGNFPYKKMGEGLGWLDVKWNGNKVLDEIDDRINKEMLRIGELVVSIAKRYTPVRSGHLQSQERFDYNLITKTLIFISDVPYDIFVEYGTRNMRPQPHWRPALNTVGPIFGINLEMSFANIPEIKNPILAVGAGFHVPSTLTAKQMAHVKQWLAPASKRHHIANVSRTRMNIRRYL